MTADLPAIFQNVCDECGGSGWHRVEPWPALHDDPRNRPISVEDLPSVDSNFRVECTKCEATGHLPTVPSFCPWCTSNATIHKRMSLYPRDVWAYWTYKCNARYVKPGIERSWQGCGIVKADAAAVVRDIASERGLDLFRMLHGERCKVCDQRNEDERTIWRWADPGPPPLDCAGGCHGVSWILTENDQARAILEPFRAKRRGYTAFAQQRRTDFEAGKAGSIDRSEEGLAVIIQRTRGQRRP